MTDAYCYTTNDDPDSPVAKKHGAGVDVAVITVEALDYLRSCRDFAEAAAGCRTVREAVTMVRVEYGADAPALALFHGRTLE